MDKNYRSGMPINVDRISAIGCSRLYPDIVNYIYWYHEEEYNA